MSKTETLRQLAAATNETRLEHLVAQIESVRRAKQQSAEELAATLEPLAQALAALTDETRQTMAEIERKSREQGEQFSLQSHTAARQWKEAVAQTEEATERMNRAVRRLEWTHYGLAVATGVVTALLVSVFWLWLAPPSIQNQLDPKAVAEYLKPAVIEALKPSRSK